MVVNIELSKDKENDEYGELQYNLTLYKQITEEIAKLSETRGVLVKTLNRTVKSAVDRNRLEREDIRGLEFPPFIVDGKGVYGIKENVLSINFTEKDAQVIDITPKE